MIVPHRPASQLIIWSPPRGGGSIFLDSRRLNNSQPFSIHYPFSFHRPLSRRAYSHHSTSKLRNYRSSDDSQRQAQIPDFDSDPHTMPYFDLPFRRERSAPVLDASDTSAIWRYFEDLEVLFVRHRVSDDAEKKRAATRYPSIEVERLWQCAHAFSDPARTYEDFKEEVIRMYPEISRDRMHTLADLEEAVGQAVRKEIRSEEDLGVYYRHFLCISRYLIERGRLAPIEQSRAFLRGFRPALAAQVRERLQAKFLDHIPGDPYATDDVFDAARFVLARNQAAASLEAQGPSRATFTLKVQTPQQTSDTAVPNPVPTPDSADPTPDAIDKLAAAVEALREMVKTTTQTRTESGELAPEAQSATSRPRRDRCKFCGREGHTFHECVIIGDYIQQGRCRYSPLGNVVLSTGAAVPGGIPGAWMRNRVDKWHQLHPGQLAEQVLSGAGAIPTTAPAPQGQAVEYPDQRTRMRPSARYIPDSVQHRRPERVQAEQHSEVYQPAMRHKVATEIIRSEEQHPELARAFAHRTEVHPGTSAESARAPVTAPKPAQTVWPASPDSPDLAVTQRESPSEAQQAQPVQRSEAPQSAKQGRAAAKISRSEEQRPETVCAYAHRTELTPESARRRQSESQSQSQSPNQSPLRSRSRSRTCSRYSRERQWKSRSQQTRSASCKHQEFSTGSEDSLRRQHRRSGSAKRQWQCVCQSPSHQRYQSGPRPAR